MVKPQLPVRLDVVCSNSGVSAFAVLFSSFHFPVSNFWSLLEFSNQQHGIEPAEGKGI
jgi:hypothetical protein